LSRASLALPKFTAAKYSGGKPACGGQAAALHMGLRRRTFANDGPHRAKQADTEKRRRDAGATKPLP